MRGKFSKQSFFVINSSEQNYTELIKSPAGTVEELQRKLREKNNLGVIETKVNGLSLYLVKQKLTDNRGPYIRLFPIMDRRKLTYNEFVTFDILDAMVKLR